MRKEQSTFEYTPSGGRTKETGIQRLFRGYLSQFQTTKVQPFSFFSVEFKTPAVVEAALDAIGRGADLKTVKLRTGAPVRLSDQIRLQTLQNLEQLERQGLHFYLKKIHVRSCNVTELKQDRIIAEGELDAIACVYDSEYKVVKGS